MHSCLGDMRWLTLSKQGVQTLFYSPLCSLTSFVFCSKTALFKCINSFIYLCSNQINNKAGVSLRVPEQRACCRLQFALCTGTLCTSTHGSMGKTNTLTQQHVIVLCTRNYGLILICAPYFLLLMFPCSGCFFLVLANDAESHYSVVHSNLQLSLGCTDSQVHQLWSSFHYSAADFQRNNNFNDYANLFPILYVVLNILSAAKQ